MMMYIPVCFRESFSKEAAEKGLRLPELMWKILEGHYPSPKEAPRGRPSGLIEVMKLLRGGPLTVQQLVDKTGLLKNTIKGHLKHLETLGNVEAFATPGSEYFYCLPGTSPQGSFKVVKGMLSDEGLRREQLDFALSRLKQSAPLDPFSMSDEAFEAVMFEMGIRPEDVHDAVKTTLPEDRVDFIEGLKKTLAEIESRE